MFLAILNIKNSDDKRLEIVKTFREPGSKYPKRKVILNCGKLSDLSKIYDDPISHFKALAKKMTDDEKNSNSDDISSFLNISSNSKTPKNTPIQINMGCIFLSFLYHSLKFDKVFPKYILNHDKKLPPLNVVFRLLTYLRILKPGSKLNNFKQKDFLAENFNVDLNDIYRSLAHFSILKDDFIKSIHDNISSFVNIDNSISHYDLTNFYVYTSETEDSKLLKRGYSKEHSNYPIVQIALLTDNNGIPLNYKLYPGNNHDVSTLSSFIKEQNKIFKFKKSIIVGDAGIISSNNIIETLKSRNGYILKKSLLKLNKEEKEMFENVVRPILENASKLNPDKVVYFDIDINVKRDTFDIYGNKIKVALPQKYVFTYSPKSFKREDIINNNLIENANKIINNSKIKKVSNKKLNSLIDISFTDIVDNETAEVIDTYETRMINKEMEEKLFKYQGYSLLVSSETKMSSKDIFNAYRKQYVIEENFKMTKDVLEARPIHLSIDEHINAHFLTCFISLVFLRILQNLLKGKYSVYEIVDSLRRYEYTNIDTNIYAGAYYDDLIEDLANIFKIKADKRYLKKIEIREMIKKSKESF